MSAKWSYRVARQKIIETENDVKKLVIGALKQYDAWSYAPIQNGMGVHGIPDRIACVPLLITESMVGATVGLFVAVESKRPGRREEKHGGASPMQANHLHAILAAGGVAMLVDGEVEATRLSCFLDMIKMGPIKNAFNMLTYLLRERTKTHG